MINGLIMAILITVSLLIAIVAVQLIITTVIDFKFGDYFKGITTALVTILIILCSIALWIGIIQRFY